MPPLATTVLNAGAIDLLSLWITNGLPGYKSFADWQTAYFGSTTAVNSEPGADPDGDGAMNRLEYVTGTNPLLKGDQWEIQVAESGTQIEISFVRVANRGFQVEWTNNLFDAKSWRLLDVPGNEPQFLSTTTVATVRETPGDAQDRFYRVRVFEP